MIRALLPLLLSPVLLVPLAAQDAVDPAPLAAWLEAHRNVKTLEATFTQERRLPTVRQPLTTRGRFWLKGDRFRWQLGEPAKTIAVKTGDTVTLTDVEKGRSRTVAADDPRVKPFAVLADPALADLASFQRQFSIQSTARVKNMDQATLVPVERRLRSKVPRIVLHIDPRTSTLRATEVHASDGSVILTIFDAPKINQPVADDVFRN